MANSSEILCERVYKPVGDVVSEAAPKSIAEALANWPDHGQYTASPVDWRDEVLYFLLPDRFADEDVSQRPLLDRRDSATVVANTAAARPANLSWQQWCESGKSRYQGGTIRGVINQLDYLEQLGVTAIWMGPVFRQRIEENSYHGYGIQNFFDVDARFGTRADLVELVGKLHQRGMKIILDVIFNHTGTNWLYDAHEAGTDLKPGFKRNGYYNTMYPRSGLGSAIHAPNKPAHKDDFVWPTDLRGDEHYWKKGSGNLGAGDLLNPLAENKVCDFESLRALNTTNPATLGLLIMIYQYWVSLTDCDGFRIDTMKHVGLEAARNWCNAVTEHAECMGKNNFFLMAEAAGGNRVQALYLAMARNIDAALDIGKARIELRLAGQGLKDPGEYFDNFHAQWQDMMGSHREQGDRHVIVLDDHDHVFGDKVRFSANAPNEYQVVAAVAIELFTLGIPCIYYGTEQALRGLPREASARPWLISQSADWLLREAMFGPEHPRASGWDGAQGEIDNSMPGFGPEGTAGHHVFDQEHPAYERMAALIKVRGNYIAARRGRQYRRATSVLQGPFFMHGAGEMLAWSRVMDAEEVLIVVNTHGTEVRGGRVALDGRLVADTLTIACDTERLNVAGRDAAGGGVAFEMAVQRPGNGLVFVDIPAMAPSEVIVLVNSFRPLV